MPKGNIIIVEDENITALEIEDILVEAGYTVLGIANSGKKALKLIEGSNPDLVIMDIRLKGKMDGIDTTKLIRERYRIPVIYLTAFFDENTIERINKFEYYGLLNKPFLADELLTAIEATIQTKKLELKLKESDDFYKDLVERAGFYILIENKDGKFLYFNERLSQLFGYSITQMKKLSLSSLIHPDDLHKILKKRSSCFKGKVTDSKLEVRCLKKDGSIIYVEIYFLCLRDGKKISGACIYFKDMTTIKLTEKKLKEKQYFVEQITENISGFIFVNDLITNKHSFVSANVKKIIGYTTEEFLNFTKKKIETLIHKDDLPEFKKNQQQILKTKNKNNYEVEIRIRQANGDWCWLHCNEFVFTKNKNGNPNQILCIATNISDRKKLEKVHYRSKQETEIRNRIIETFLIFPDERMYEKILEIVLEVTKSQYGLFGYFNNNGDFIVPATSRDIYWEKCQISEKAIVFEKEMFAAPWGKMLKKKKSFFFNEGPFNIPAGHIVINNTMLTPIIYQDKIISTIQIANKSKGYNEEDQLLLETIARYISPVLNARLETQSQAIEKKETQNELRLSEEKFNLMIQNSPDLTMITNPEGVSIYLSPNAEKVIGQKTEKFLGKKMHWDFIYPDDLNWVMDAFSKAMAGEEICDLEYRVLSNKGNIIWLLHTARPLFIDKKLVWIQSNIKNITKFKKQEEELRKFKIVSDMGNYGSAIVDLDGNIIYINKTFAEMHGYDKKEIIGKNLSIFHTQEQMKRVNLLNAILKKEGRYSSEEVWHKRVDGTIFPTLMNATIIFDEGQLPLFMSATAIDITKQKESEDALVKREREIRTISNNIPALISYIDADGYYRFVNDQHAKWFKLSIEKVVGKHFRDVHGEIFYKQTNKYVKKVLSGQQVTYERHLSYDNKVKRWVIANYVPDFDDKRKVKGFFALVTDITERKQTEEEIQLLGEVVDNMLEGVLLVRSNNAKIVLANPRISEVSGYALDELVGKNLTKFIAPVKDRSPKKIVTEISAELEKSGIWKGELSYKKIDGSLIWNTSNISTLMSNRHGKIWVVVLDDITEQKKTKLEIKNQQKELQNLHKKLINTQEEEKKKVSMELHDEIGQAIVGVQLNLSMIEQNISSDSKSTPAVKENLKEINQSINHVFKRIHEMSLFLYPSMLGDLGLVATLRWYTRSYSKKTHIKVNFRSTGLKERLPQNIETTLYRVAQEALTNVFKHAHAQAVFIYLNIKKVSAELSIKDDGKGFDFEQVKKKEAAHYGIGLSGMKQRINFVGGKINIHSSLGLGTKISIKIPLKGNL